MINILEKLQGIKLYRRHNSTLEHRFIAAVLIPPFIVLLGLGAFIIWQLNGFVRNQAVGELNRAAASTAAKLEREFALRQTVLKRTGEELFVIKSQYQASLKKLETDRTACSAHLKQKKDFRTAPGNACKPFMAEFATSGATQAAVEDGYIKVGQELSQTQKGQINERLTSYGQFFPETLVLIVTDKDGDIVSSALADEFKGSTAVFDKELVTARTESIEGKLVSAHNFRLGVFAYPIASGSVLAAYDLSSNSFLKESWDSTPIDRARSLTVILDAQGKPAYPGVGLQNQLESSSLVLRNNPFATIAISNIVHIATGVEVKGSKWLVVVASPKTVVLSPVRNAQIVAVLIVGTLLVGFLWVGTYFIRKTLRSILRLVGGSIVFAAGRLDYKIKLENADEEFIDLANTMNSMAERIATAEKEIDEKNKEFISVATHELRTPLTGIIGNLSIVLEDMPDRLDNVVKPLIEQTYEGTVRLRNLVNDMLDVARLEGGRTEFNIVALNAQAVVSNVVDTLQVTARQEKVILIYNKSEALSVLADESHLRIVLNNFISNAIKYNRPGGRVTVTHVLQEGKLVFSVADTGLGIPEDQKAHMFEKFFRVQGEDRKNIVGTGLGMYITKEYVIKMGGEVWFESVHGEGTTFYFSLPIAQKSSIAPVPNPVQ